MHELTKSQLLILEIVKQLGGKIDDKTKLAKLEYFSDFIHFAFNDASISSDQNVYQRRKQGPLSRTFNEDLIRLCDLELLNQVDTYTFETNPANVESEGLTDLEMKTIKYVIARYGGSSWSELRDIAHSQIPYLSASGDGAVIEYHTAYNLVDEYPDYVEFVMA